MEPLVQVTCKTDSNEHSTQNWTPADRAYQCAAFGAEAHGGTRMSRGRAVQVRTVRGRMPRGVRRSGGVPDSDRLRLELRAHRSLKTACARVAVPRYSISAPTLLGCSALLMLKTSLIASAQDGIYAGSESFVNASEIGIDRNLRYAFCVSALLLGPRFANEEEIVPWARGDTSVIPAAPPIGLGAQRHNASQQRAVTRSGGLRLGWASVGLHTSWGVV